jgi:hypothetical protein
VPRFCVGDEAGVGGLQAGPDGIQRIGPVVVDQLVLPLVVADREHE